MLVLRGSASRQQGLVLPKPELGQILAEPKTAEQMKPLVEQKAAEQAQTLALPEPFDRVQRGSFLPPPGPLCRN